MTFTLAPSLWHLTRDIDNLRADGEGTRGFCTDGSWLQKYWFWGGDFGGDFTFYITMTSRNIGGAAAPSCHSITYAPDVVIYKLDIACQTLCVIVVSGILK